MLRFRLAAAHCEAAADAGLDPSIRSMATVTPFKRDIFILKNPASVYDDYAFKGALGDGGSGQVLRAVHKRTGITRAVKRIAKKSTNYRQFEAEVRALISLDHPHILKVIEYFEDANYFYVVTEICLGQDVFDYMSDRMRASGKPGLTEREAGMIIRQALKAVNGCHSKGIIHRDLKLENFMFMGVDHTIKLIDFGFAKRCGKDEFHTEVVGTKEYMAPEMFKGRVYDTSVDIWSLGVMLFAMLTGEFLLPAGQDRKRLQDPNFIAGRLASCRRIQDLSPETRDFLAQMLQVDPSARPTAAQALKHPFIQRNWHGSVDSRLFQYKFDRELPEKMKRFAEAPLLRKIGLLCVVHLVGASVLQAEVRDELLAARHNFRSLNKSGTGVVTEEDIRRRLAVEGIAIPEDFSRTVARCSCGLGDQGEDGLVGYTPLVAALLMDSLASKWPQCFFREAFNIMDRSRNGVIEVSDLIALTGGNDTRSYHVVFREVDTDGIGYINYDKFMSIVGAGSCANQLQQQQLGVTQQSTQVQAPTRPAAEAKAAARPGRPAGLPLAQALAFQPGGGAFVVAAGEAVVGA